jgi:WXXGXW repeat (2 copies)
MASNIGKLILTAALSAGAVVLSVPQARAEVFVGISVHIGPPALPVYAQPPIPAEGYLWTPGYWGYGDAGYYWIPGVWVRPPSVGLLWTPGYWGFARGVYGWHGGYWGPHVGFYGGVNYGFGYGGVGFGGGVWSGGAFRYNTAVCNFGGVHVRNTYIDRTVINNTTINRTSFNGPGGIQHEPTPQERQFQGENHVQPTANQMSHETAAGHDRGQLASVNGGHPATMAASSHESYGQVAQQHERSQPISASDRAAGSKYQPNQREANQDQRISNGLKSGQMTSGEASRAENRQSAIDSQVHNDREANDGKLTGAERQQVNREQNGASRQIYDEKHNGNTVTPNKVDDREANQQQRVANGLRSGQETSGEAGRSNANQARVAKEVHNDRTANGGALTKQEKQQVNRQQNQNSKQIKNQKHNNATHEPKK